MFCDLLGSQFYYALIKEELTSISKKEEQNFVTTAFFSYLMLALTL